jgi:hypothetical protein
VRQAACVLPDEMFFSFCFVCFMPKKDNLVHSFGEFLKKI